MAAPHIAMMRVMTYDGCKRVTESDAEDDVLSRRRRDEEDIEVLQVGLRGPKLYT